MGLHSGTSISYDVEPFLKNYGEKATDSAFPHGDSPLPVSVSRTSWGRPILSSAVTDNLLLAESLLRLAVSGGR